MDMTRFLAVLAIGVTMGTALAQQAPPTANKGLSVSSLSGLDLSKQGLNDYDRRQMRIRQISLEPVTLISVDLFKE